MITVDLSKVVIPENRIRRDFDRKKLDELKDSILRNGLFHPITVEAINGTFVLRAGERRLRVLRELSEAGHEIRCGSVTHPRESVPAVSFDELNDLQRLEIEIEETCVRDDFKWQDRTAGYARLHQLRAKQNPGQSVSATASEILGKPAAGDQIMQVSDALIVAKHLDDPEVAGAKDQREAVKIIRKRAEAVHRAVLAQKFDPKAIPHRLIKGSMLDELPKLPDASFDIILTDPPYGVGADNFGSQAATGHDYRDSYKYWKELLPVFCDHSARVAKERAHAYVFCDPRRFEELATWMLLAGWTPFPTPLIWDKSNGMLPLPEHGPRRTYECILYCYKGDRKTLVVKNDVIRIPSVKTLKHGAQKPVALYENLLSRSANPGDTVLDCFGGSGPIFVASNRMSLVATYVEDNEEAYNVALTRVGTNVLDDGTKEDDGISLQIA